MARPVTLFAQHVLLAEGWAENALITIDAQGVITGIDTYKSISDDGDAEIITGFLVPGMANAHAMSFQRLIAGLAERGQSGRRGSFWGWRDTMYRAIENLNPEALHAVTAQVYVDMLKAGYTSVGEFHYLHNRADGGAYAPVQDMSDAVIEAAVETGIGLTFMPSLYVQGGFDGAPLNEVQRRFAGTTDMIAGMLQTLRSTYAGNPHIDFGFAPHSLRAVPLNVLQDAVTLMKADDPSMPVHIHIAGQRQEVTDCQAYTGNTPMRLLLDHLPVDESWTLVHGTHADTDELDDVARRGAVIALCPSSEANLGDGVIDLPQYMSRGGKFAIGSGSQATINPFEELRWVEYAQRLRHGERTIVYAPDITSVGAALWDLTGNAGAQSLRRGSGRIEIGARADLVVLDSEAPEMAGKVRDHILDTAVFAPTSRHPVTDVMAGGRWVVRQRRHKREELISGRFKKVCGDLLLR